MPAASIAVENLMAVRNWRVAVALLVGCFFGQMALYRTGALALPTNYRLGPGLVPDTALAIARAHRGLP
ncbi:hypothetical protein, partial [Staphylococcus epidermidis]|uniref:hypothetical protein n=1 Tax=Staphylococcus epidermidis TaxID=1282 RepID=UPI00273889E3